MTAPSSDTPTTAHEDAQSESTTATAQDPTNRPQPWRRPATFLRTPGTCKRERLTALWHEYKIATYQEHGRATAEFAQVCHAFQAVAQQVNDELQALHARADANFGGFEIELCRTRSVLIRGMGDKLSRSSVRSTSKPVANKHDFGSATGASSNR